MKVLDILPVGLVLWFANQLVDSKITCSKDHFTVVKNGTESCLRCNHCPDGSGLSPPCGSKVNHPPPIDCVPCVAGKTYSDGYDPSSCKNCHLCSAKEIVTRKCTVTHNTICSNTCKEGYYFENSTHSCLKCSDCCSKDTDTRVKECKSMPSNKQCSIHSAQQCKPEPATTVTVVVTAYPSSKAGTTSNTVPKKVSVGVIIASVIGVVVAVIFIIVLIFYKRRKKTKRRNIDHNEAGREVADGPANPLLNEHDVICDLNHMPLNITIKSPNQISEGQRISLSLSCDNQNGDIKENSRKCNFGFQWKKDGDTIPKNNYQNYCKDLTIDNVEVADSGGYYCEIHCNKYPNHKENSSTVEIHVQPGEGREFKLFCQLVNDKIEKIAYQLTPKTVEIGNWIDLGREFDMDKDVLKALENDQAAARQVLDYIQSSHPRLTVFDFCVVLKRMKQNRTVNLLKDELTKPKENEKPGIDASYRPDSGIISEESDSDGPLRVILPPHDGPVKAVASSKPSHLLNPALNLSYADSSRDASRESSVEDLSDSFFVGVQNSKPLEVQGFSKGSKPRFSRRKKSGDSQNSSEEKNDSKDDKDQDLNSDTGMKSRYGRQTSKDSQKSVDNDDVGFRERKRSRSSSITNSIKGLMQKQPSVDYSPLDHHHEESDENVYTS